MIENMVNNFAYLIDKIGYIPNGNRSYYKGRSQPPFFSLMVKLLAEEKADDVTDKIIPAPTRKRIRVLDARSGKT